MSIGIRIASLGELDLMRGAMSAVGGRFSYPDCRPELLGHYEAQDYDPLYYHEDKGLYMLIKSLG